MTDGAANNLEGRLWPTNPGILDLWFWPPCLTLSWRMKADRGGRWQDIRTSTLHYTSPPGEDEVGRVVECLDWGRWVRDWMTLALDLLRLRCRVGCFSWIEIQLLWLSCELFFCNLIWIEMRIVEWLLGLDLEKSTSGMMRRHLCCDHETEPSKLFMDIISINEHTAWIWLVPTCSPLSFFIWINKFRRFSFLLVRVLDVYHLVIFSWQSASVTTILIDHVILWCFFSIFGTSTIFETIWILTYH